MLGTGATLTRLLFIASGGSKFSPHINLGFTVAGGGTNVGNQGNYAGGVEYAPSPKVTIIGDLLGRTLTDSQRFNSTTVPHAFQQGPTASVETTTLQTISSTSGNLNTVLGAAGVKMNPGGTFLISAHVLFPLTDSGLEAKVTPVIGIDYTF